MPIILINKNLLILYLCLFQEVNVTDFNPKRIPQSGNITITIFGINFNISNPTLVTIRLVETVCEITNRE